MKKTIRSDFGSIRSGTMLNEDLIPCFADELEYWAKKNNNTDDLKFIEELEERMLDDDGEYIEEYWDSEEASLDLESLFDRLNEYAPEYGYFGAHPGDGSDYGFWLSENFEYDFEGLKVDDTSEVPKGYNGEVLHVNDHGNMTLYQAKRGKLTEVWGLV
jgi:hypothetical protein